MNVKTSLIGLRGIFIGMVVAILLLASCDNASDILNADDTQNVNSESVSESYITESSDLSSKVIASLSRFQYAGARTEGQVINVNDDRFNCGSTSITLTRTGTKDAPSGTIVIDFGTGCTDSKGVTRKGKIYVKYGGLRWTPGSHIKDSLVNYYRDDVHIEGVYSVTIQLSADTTHLQFLSELVGGKITFGDGLSVSRTHTLTRQWNRATLPVNDEWITLAGGSATGTNKEGDYEMVITEDLIEKASCLPSKVFVPVSGKKFITTGSKEYTIDYGNGNCDNNISVTVNGKTKTITVSGEGN